MVSFHPTLPQLDERLFLTDSGLETTLIHRDGLALPEFAAFVLLETAVGSERLRRYFQIHADIARRAGAGLIAESATWRANPDWGLKLGYDQHRLADVNRAAISLLADVRDHNGLRSNELVISGCVGPRWDGYSADGQMSPGAAEAYHAEQIGVFARTEADLVSALTITNAAEAIGITRAAQRLAVPVVISFTVETDGRLPSGATVEQAIREVDTATGFGPAYYMINCAHPSHFEARLDEHGEWIGRLRGIRANASKRSHAELDAATELDDGDPDELARDYGRLVRRLPHLTILGGCCGTDERHIQAIADTFGGYRIHASRVRGDASGNGASLVPPWLAGPD
jgi:S-methylmethionine-dependent homocysteine/selenocysteine methylase